MHTVIVLAVGVVAGYAFRGLIAREDKKALAALQGEYTKLVSQIRAKAVQASTSVTAQAEAIAKAATHSTWNEVKAKL